MRLNAVKVLGISITNTPKNKILEEIQKYLDQIGKKGQKPLIIFTPNTEQLVRAQRDPSFAGILNRADIAIPDTIGVVWASQKLTKNGVQKAIPGVEFIEDLVKMVENRHVPIGLIGGRGNLAVKTLNCLRKKYSGVQGWAIEPPEFSVISDKLVFVNSESGIVNSEGNRNEHIQRSPFSIHDSNEKIYFERLARRIVREGTRIVFVALGPPKQEYFIKALSDQLSVIRKTGHRSPTTDNSSIILMAVGGSFDIISGRLRRAPAIMRNLGLEWLWRLILEPWRIGRQLALVEFVWLVLRAKFSPR